jgi:hypothetical protein
MIMTYVDTATRGATRQSWARDSIRAIFREIQVEHPKAGHKQLVKLLVDRMDDDHEAKVAAADYIVQVCLEALESYMKRERQERYRPTPAEKQAREEAIEATAESIKNQLLLLNLEMPNGKRMRFCTGTEMANFGSAYQRIGKKCGGKMVGSVLDEKEVRALVQ